MEKRNIQISLEEAREWYNSGDSFKKELALKAYKKEELEETYLNIINKLPYDTTRKNSIKRDMYVKLLNIAKYYNNLYPIKYNSHLVLPIYYIITKKSASAFFFKYKGFYINESVVISEYEIVFNSKEAAKRAIDILGDELNILFE